MVPAATASLTVCNGVEVVIASGRFMLTPCVKNENRLLPSERSMGATNCVITPVHASIRKMRAVMAGLAKFFPIPPKSIFTMIIANAAPTIGT